jgi:hypothetical protein
MPSDAWPEAGLWFVVFDLKPGNKDSVAMFVIDVAAQRVISVQRIGLDLEQSVASVFEVKPG